MGYKSKFKGAEIDAHLEKMVNVTYAELKVLRDEGKLIAGQMYRMTDYETTCTWANTQVAGHPFDLVLTALDNKTLDEKCSAIQSARDKDGYFANSNLAAWDVRYCLDNDTERFVWEKPYYGNATWVDANNGKGVIYRLTDEAENSAPYDFKNIMFSKPLTNGEYDNINGVNTFCYTFSKYEQSSSLIKDCSLDISSCHNNKIGDYCYNNVFFGGGFANVLGVYCTNNTFGIYCKYNILREYCNFNTFGHYFEQNTLESEAYSNVFGNYCKANRVDGSYNSFGDSCSNNNLKSCSDITLGHGCSDNNFESGCKNNTLGEYCSYNTFGADCKNNTFVEYCNNNVLGNGCKKNTFVNGETASSDKTIQHYNIGCVSEQTIQVYRKRNYQTFITTDKNGNIVEYTVDDIINK